MQLALILQRLYPLCCGAIRQACWVVDRATAERGRERGLCERVVHNWTVCSGAFVPQLIERSHINFLLNAVAISLPHSQQNLPHWLFCAHTPTRLSATLATLFNFHTQLMWLLCVCVEVCTALIQVSVCQCVLADMSCRVKWLTNCMYLRRPQATAMGGHNSSKKGSSNNNNNGNKCATSSETFW